MMAPLEWSRRASNKNGGEGLQLCVGVLTSPLDVVRLKMLLCGVTVGTVIAAHSPMAQPAWLTNSSGTVPSAESRNLNAQTQTT